MFQKSYNWDIQISIIIGLVVEEDLVEVGLVGVDMGCQKDSGWGWVET